MTQGRGGLQTPRGAPRLWGLALGRQAQFIPGVREPGEVEASPEKTLTPLHTLWDPGQKQRSLGQTDLPADLAVFPKRQEAPWGQTLVHPFPGACSILGALVNTSLEFSRWPSSLASTSQARHLTGHPLT